MPTRLIGVILLVAALVVPVGSLAAPPAPPTTYDPDRFAGDVEWVAKTLGADTLFLLTSPLRLDTGDLVPLAIGTTALGAAFGLDHAIRDEAKRHKDALHDAADGIGYLGNAGVLLGLNVGFVAVGEGLRQHDGDAKVRDAALASTEAQVLSLALSVGLQTVTGRSRPRRERGLGHFEPGSVGGFPSNHASQAFAVASVLADRFGWQVGVVSYGAASLVALSRIGLDEHWTSDVVAGAILGTLVGHVLSVRHRTPHGFIDFAPFVEPETKTYGLSLRTAF